MKDFFDWFCKISFVIVSIVVLNSIFGDVMFRLKYSFPKVSATTNQVIDTFLEPVQTDLDGKKYIKHYGEKNQYALNLMAEYSISGLVVAKNNNFWFRDVMRTSFDDLALIDFGIVWGDLAKDKELLYDYASFKSKKTLGQARQLQPRWQQYPLPWSVDYFNTHVSHTHMIPANSNVMGGLLQIKKNNVVKIDGYLVDIYTSKSELVAHTSMSRTDTNATSRGSGACEDMYVKQVQIGNKIYK